jgi:protein TonB
LGAYRQNLLREGARRIGIESKYLYTEHRVTAFVSAKAPPQLKNVLTRLALLPGPNALPAAKPPEAHGLEPAPVAVAAATETSKPSAPVGEPDVRTVSLDSLPVLTTEPPTPRATPLAAAIAATPRAKPAPVAKAEPKPTTKSVRATPRVEKPEPVAKAEPKAKPKAEPRPPANENPLKAAIRLAIAADAAKAAKNK